MGTYAELKAAIRDVIRENGNNDITGASLQQVLLSIIDSVGANATYAGVATPTTNPGNVDSNVFFIASYPGIYSSFNGIEIKSGEFAIIANKSNTWVKTTLDIVSAYGIKSIFTPNNANRNIIESIISNIYIVDNLARNINWAVTYFWLNSQNFGVGNLLIQITATGELNAAYNFRANVVSVKPNQYLKLNLLKDSQAAQNLNGIDLYVRMAQNYVYSTAEKLVTDKMQVNHNYVTNALPFVANIIDTATEMLPKYGIVPYYPGKSVYNIQEYGEYGVIVNDFANRKKVVLYRGDFDLIENIEEDKAREIRKNIKNLKLINGFVKGERIFISSVKWKAGGENDYFYIKLASLPAGDYAFEWRIPANSIKKGIPCYITDEARGKTILLTLSDNADDTFATNVVYYQDSLLNQDSIIEPSNNDIRYHYITVSSTAPFAIRNKVHEYAGKASYYDRYIINVPNGNYFELDIVVPNYITIRGQSESGVVIKLDGTSTTIAPDDITLGTGGIPINQIATENKHIFWLCANATIENMTLEVNTAKYAIHQDSDVQAYESHVRNVTLVDKGSIVKLVGIGGWANQKLYFENCTFKTSSSIRQAVIFHNWTNQKAPTELHFIGCVAQHDLVWVQELGSGKQDIVKIVNCVSKSPYEGNIQYSKASGYTNAAICIKIIIEGKSLGTYSSVSGYTFMNIN